MGIFGETRLSVYGLVSPPVGTHDIVVSFSGSDTDNGQEDVAVSAATYTGQAVGEKWLDTVNPGTCGTEPTPGMLGDTLTSATPGIWTILTGYANNMSPVAGLNATSRTSPNEVVGLFDSNGPVDASHGYTMSATEDGAGFNLSDMLAIAPDNAPVASGQAVSVDENASTTVALAATDQDGDALTYSIVAQPSHGVLSGDAPNLTYTPEVGYVGADSFTLKANDTVDDSNVATVSIAVNAVVPPAPPPPPAPADSGGSISFAAGPANPLPGALAASAPIAPAPQGEVLGASTERATNALTPAQIETIITALLQAFGVDATTIARVRAALG
jgi:hypothetical protein